MVPNNRVSLVLLHVIEQWCEQVAGVLVSLSLLEQILETISSLWY